MKFQLSGAPSGAGPIREKNFSRRMWRWPPGRRVLSFEPLARKTAARRPPPRFLDNRLENSLSNSKSMGYVIFPSKSENEVSA